MQNHPGPKINRWFLFKISNGNWHFRRECGLLAIPKELVFPAYAHLGEVYDKLKEEVK